MPSGGLLRRSLTTLAGVVALSLGAAGCVSMPSGGPVLSYPVTQGPSSQGQPYQQIIPPSPDQGWGPSEIVQGFMAASASFVGQQQVAREYLTPAASDAWHPTWQAATVFTGGPAIAVAARQDTATATVSGGVQATLNNGGAYAVASAKPKTGTFHFDLARYHGQWRISNMYKNPLLLTSTEFAADYQLRKLYFFDPSARHLVPDPVYVPLQATQDNLVNGLVRDLIRQPRDWLGQGGATRTAFPAGTTLQGVTVDGMAALVYLSLPPAAASRVSGTVKAQVSAQLWYTLSGAGQGQQGQVQSVALYINGRPYVPPGASPGNPVQSRISQYAPADGPRAPGVYYLTKAGQLMTRDPATGRSRKLSVIGRGYTSLAVSPDGEYVAALRGGTGPAGGSVYTGAVGAHSLTFRDAGMGATSLSWDRNDNLWVVGNSGIVVLLATQGKPATPPTPVTITSSLPACGNSGEVTAIRVAPDGVRVAIVYGQQAGLAFGAIVPPDAQGQQFTVRLSPFSVCGTSPGAFKALSWYGANDVVALGEPGDTLTEYPVNGGAFAAIPGPDHSGIQWITASGGGKGGNIVAGASGGAMFIDTGGSGAWSPLPAGLAPAFPG